MARRSRQTWLDTNSEKPARPSASAAIAPGKISKAGLSRVLMSRIEPSTKATMPPIVSAPCVGA